MTSFPALIRRLLLPSIWILVLQASVTSCSAQPSSKGMLLALSKSDHTLAMVDPVSLKVIAKAPVGQDPHEVIASSDGKTAYVSIYGGGSLHELNVIDLITHKAVKNIDTRPLFGPHGLDFINGEVWFTAEGSKAVGRYNPSTGKLDWSMGTGQDRTHMLYVTPDGKRIYTTNVNAGTVSILEPGSNSPGNRPPGPPPGAPPAGRGPGMGGQRQEWSETVIPVSRGCEGFDVSPDGKELWTASSDDGYIYIVSTSDKKLITRVDAGVQGANRLKISPDGKKVLISSLRSGDLTVYDAQTRQLIKRIPIGHGAAGILMDPDGSRAFVACTPDNYVAVIDLNSLAVTSHIDVGGGPDGLAWAK